MTLSRSGGGDSERPPVDQVRHIERVERFVQKMRPRCIKPVQKADGVWAFGSIHSDVTNGWTKDGQCQCSFRQRSHRTPASRSQLAPEEQSARNGCVAIRSVASGRRFGTEVRRTQEIAASTTLGGKALGLTTFMTPSARFSFEFNKLGSIKQKGPARSNSQRQYVSSYQLVITSVVDRSDSALDECENGVDNRSTARSCAPANSIKFRSSRDGEGRCKYILTFRENVDAEMLRLRNSRPTGGRLRRRNRYHRRVERQSGK